MKKFVIAMLKHETNTFSPIPTYLNCFGKGEEPAYGQEALQRFAGTRTPIGAFIDLAQNEGVEFQIPVAGEANPSGPVAVTAFEALANRICEAVQAGCDATFLDLHGAMVTENEDDGEGALLARIRQIAPELPIAVALDSHTNLSDTMVNNSSVIVGYKTYPHVDMYETGEQAGRILIRSLKGEIEPAMVWNSRPMLTHMLQQRPTEYPMNEVMQIAKAAENDSSALAATVFGGFPLADTPFTSLSSVIVFDGSRPKAENLCRNILDSAWERPADFVYRSKSLTESVTRAKTMDQYPILLIDHGDNCGAGGTQDDMTVLEEIIRQELDDVAVGTIWDPQAVEEMIQAGTGSQVTIALGGKTDSPAIGHVGRPIKISGTVRNITDGRFKITGPMYTGVSAHMGKTVVLEIDRVQIVVTENRIEPFDIGLFTSVGIKPKEKKYLMLKSRHHYRAGFGPIAGSIVECAGRGVASSDHNQFPFKKIKRPIYPLDDF